MRKLISLLTAIFSLPVIAQVYPYFSPNLQQLSSVNTQSGTTYTLQLTDKNSLVLMSNTTANITVTIPPHSSVPFAVGVQILVEQASANTGFVTSIQAGVGVITHCQSCQSAGPATFLLLTQSAQDVWEVNAQTYPQGSAVFGNGICAGCIGPSGSTTWTGDKGNTGTGIVFMDGGMWLLDTAGGLHAFITTGYDIPHTSLIWESNADEAIDPLQDQRSANLEIWLTETSNHTVIPHTDAATGYFLNATSGNVTLTLPAANYATASQNIRGISEEVCRTDGSVNTATVAAAGADKIDGVASITLARYECLKLQSDSSTNWYEISKITGP